MTMTIKQKCSCGAEIELTREVPDLSDLQESELRQWKERHKDCKPSSPVNVPSVQLPPFTDPVGVTYVGDRR
jgi:hypothetical protein